MWRSIAQFILKFKHLLLSIILLLTVLFGYFALQVGLSYEYAKAIPTNHPSNITYQKFKAKYGEDGNLIVVGIQNKDFFTTQFLQEYKKLQTELEKTKGVLNVFSTLNAFNLVKEPATEKLSLAPLFKDSIITDPNKIIQNKAILFGLPFYKGLLFNAQTHSYIMALRMDKSIINSAARVPVVKEINEILNHFSQKNKVETHVSGLPYIRTILSERISNEMRYFLIGSILLSAIILLLFFKSISATVLSLAVVLIGVVFSIGTMYLFGYSITLLTALIPPLIVVIGIPNCIYFLNKYHSSWLELESSTDLTNKQKKHTAIINMVSKMGIVTLFCNVAAAIGFAVFAFTKSALLKEFGIISGINIMMLFVVSLIMIPSVLSMMRHPKKRHLKYLHNRTIRKFLTTLQHIAIHKRKLVYIVTAIILVISIAGIFKLKNEAYMVDDLPQDDKLYTDLKFFENNFTGIMPLEIIVDTKKKYGVTRNYKNISKLDSLVSYLHTCKALGKSLSLIEGLKFAKQALYEGDSSSYSIPSEFELPALAGYLNSNKEGEQKNSLGNSLMLSFLDSTKQEARISVNMADIGTKNLPPIIDSITQKTNSLFPKENYNVSLTGASIVFNEGSQFIINGLKESIFWAFLLITLCMLYLFKSFRVLICSLIPNLVPLIITAGVMGWVGVPLKPSTVLVFSVALGIAVDITIRFLVNYKQELTPHANKTNIVVQSIQSTGISITYTSLVLIAGFAIFCVSGFGGTQSLGWLTSLTLVVATLTNLLLLPALLISTNKEK